MAALVLSFQHPHGALCGVRPPADAAGLAEMSAELLPEEQRLAAEMGFFRASTFVAGRVALRAALEVVGAPGLALLQDARGAPTCPPGFVGSIAHKPELAVALAAPGQGFGLGVDVEIYDRERWRILPKILTEAEIAELSGHATAEQPTGPWREALARFAIKEAIYKAVDPIVRRYVGFEEAELLELSLPEPSTLEDPRFVSTAAELRLARETLGVTVEASWADGPFLLATARVRAGSRRRSSVPPR